MKDTFKEYYPLSSNEHEAIWRDAIIVFDTNVLLNFYRYSEPTVNRFIKVLKEIESHVWIPHQVALEFHKNRTAVIEQQVRLYSEYNKKMDELKKNFENKNRNPFLSDGLLSETQAVFQAISDELKSKEKYFKDLILNDELLNSISQIFQNKIGEALSKEEYDAVLIEGADRYKNNIPPGYRDNNKKGNDKYGDLFVWKQIIKQAQNKKKKVLFISDDNKEDWWEISLGQKIIPRPLLRKEFYDETGNEFYIYHPFRFLEYSNYLTEDITNPEVIQEVRDFRVNNSKEQIFTIEIELIDKLIIKQFVDAIVSNGYEVATQSTNDKSYFITVLLPHMNDICRRFKAKISNLAASYEIKIIRANLEDF